MNLTKIFKQSKSPGKKALVIFALASSLLFGSCGKDCPTLPTPTPPELPNNSFTLEDNTKELTEFSSYTNGSIRYNSGSSELTNLSIGDIVYSLSSEYGPNGFLRKVADISGNNVSTSRATINEAVESCNVEQSFSILPQNKALLGEKGINFNVPINTVLYDQDGDPSTAEDQITIQGNLDFELNVPSFKLKTNIFGVQNFHMTAVFNGDTELELDAKIDFLQNIEKKIFPDQYGVPIPTPIPGVALTPKLTFYGGINGSVQASTQKITNNLLITTTINYNGSSWDDSNIFASNELELGEESFEAEMNLKVYATVKVELLVSDFIGPYVGFEAYGKARVAPSEDPWWTVHGGLTPSIGAKIQAFGWNIADFNAPIINFEEFIAQAESNPQGELIARLNVTPTSGIAPLEVLLNGSYSTPSNEITKYEFNFFDGTPVYFETSSNAPDGNFDGMTSHVYAEGNFQPILTVFRSGETAEDTANVSVGGGGGDPPEGQIAFISWRDGNGEIYVMNADGSNQTRLTNNLDNDRSPDWSPDGNKIAFNSNRDGDYEIYVMNADGSNQTRLTNNSSLDDEPSWSPDGTKITFTSERDGDREVYVMNSNGTNQRNLTNNSSGSEYSSLDDEPSWSPDGTKIAFISQRNGNPEIYTMNADGTNPTMLTNYSSSKGDPSWSPDGSKIVFWWYRNYVQGIYIMDSDGTNQEGVALAAEPMYKQKPSWSPDGLKIAFDAWTNGDNQNIYVINLDGSNKVRLTNNLSTDINPSWRPAQ